MNINAPTPRQIPQLKALWKQAFGDSDAFIDGFFANGFSPERCRCLSLDNVAAAALYWFPMEYCGRNFAYLYAVATEEAHRGKGFCRNLMEDTHKHLAALGYAGAVLVPAGEHLWRYYGKMGYLPFGSSRSFSADSASGHLSLQEISAERYGALRKKHLPAGALSESQISFFATWGQFWQGENCLLAASESDGCLYVQEFLGDTALAPYITAALGCSRGIFRTPGGEDPCGMHLLFENTPAPTYLGFPLD